MWLTTQRSLTAHFKVRPIFSELNKSYKIMPFQEWLSMRAWFHYALCILIWSKKCWWPVFAWSLNSALVNRDVMGGFLTNGSSLLFKCLARNHWATEGDLYRLLLLKIRQDMTKLLNNMHGSRDIDSAMHNLCMWEMQSTTAHWVFIPWTVEKEIRLNE